MHPWSLAFLPDGRMLVTERPGRMRIVTRDGKLSPPLADVPHVFAVSQGGLLDVALDRDFAQNRTIYFSYAEPFDGGGRTALARAKLDAGEAPRLTDVTVIYRQHGPASRGGHFGGRIVQARRRQSVPHQWRALHRPRHGADARQRSRQDRAHHAGRRGAARTIRSSAKPARGRKSGPTATAIRKASRSIRPTANCGSRSTAPMGGDEINIIAPGRNYGWPLVSHGVNYDGTPVGTGKAHMAGMEDPALALDAVDRAVRHDVLYRRPVQGLERQPVQRRAEIPDARAARAQGDKVVKEERLLQGLRERIRDVRQGPDGALYLLTDNNAGRILRVAPAK